MSRRDPAVSLRQMRDHAQEAVELVRGRSRSDLDADRLLALAVVRLLEIIGEAARNVPDDFAAAHPEVPWPRIAGLRNRIVHDYFGLDLEIIWQILQTDLPQLKSQLPTPGTGA